MIKTGLTGLTGIIVLCLITSCENNLKDVEDISFGKPQVIVDKSYGLEMIFSDSAIVKTKVTTPEAYHYKTQDPYYEMNRGILAIFYEIDQKEKGRVKADYAIWRENQRIVDLKKNVVITSSKGQVVKSEEVIWDQNKHTFYSDKLVSLISPNASGTPTILYGDGFTSDEGLQYPVLIRARGDIRVLNQPGF